MRGTVVRAGGVLCAVALALLLAACGPDLSLLDAPGDLYITAIALTGPQSGWAVGLQPSKQRALLLREANGAWQLDPNPPPTQEGDALKAVAVTGATLWVAGVRTDATHGDATQESGFVLARSANGAWQREQFNNPINAIAFTSATDGWAVGDGGAMYHDQNGTWTQISNDMANDLYAIAVRAPDDIWATGEYGEFLHYNGATWQAQPHFAHENFYGLALSATDGWAVGDDGTTVRLGSDALWYEFATPMNVTGRAVALSGTTVWITGDHGLVFTYATDTGQWQHLAPPAGDAQLNTVAAAPDGSVWVGGNVSQDALYSYTDGDWRAVSVALGK
jgi:hypothetical protein